MNDSLSKFQAADWERITLVLLKYALFKVRRLEWKTGSFLPKGMLPEDLALDAIRKTCEGLMANESAKGIRIWDPEKQPDLLSFLKGVIDSDVNALVESAEHRLTNYSSDLPSNEAAEATTRMIDIGSSSGGASLSLQQHSPSAEDVLIQAETVTTETQRLTQLFEDLVRESSDDEEELLILMAYQEASERHEKVKPAFVARYAGLDEKTARNAMRRLTRKVERRRFNG